MDRTVGEAQRTSRSRRGLANPRLLLGRKARGRHIDRLLEERAIQWVGLVEDGQHLELATSEQPLDRDLLARDEVFDQHGLTRTIGPAGGNDRRHSGEDRRKVHGAVGLHHALGSGKVERLDDARVGHRCCDRLRVGVDCRGGEVRSQQTLIREALTHPCLVAGSFHGIDRVVR